MRIYAFYERKDLVNLEMKILTGWLNILCIHYNFTVIKVHAKVLQTHATVILLAMAMDG